MVTYHCCHSQHKRWALQVSSPDFAPLYQGRNCRLELVQQPAMWEKQTRKSKYIKAANYIIHQIMQAFISHVNRMYCTLCWFSPHSKYCINTVTQKKIRTPKTRKIIPGTKEKESGIPGLGETWKNKSSKLICKRKKIRACWCLNLSPNEWAMRWHTYDPRT